jgi:hypothetical protein
MFKFQEEDVVVLKEAQGDYLPAGTVGSVFCQYKAVPLAYEVNFQIANGQVYASIVSEPDLEAASAAAVAANPGFAA